MNPVSQSQPQQVHAAATKNLSQALLSDFVVHTYNSHSEMLGNWPEQLLSQFAQVPESLHWLQQP